MSLHPMRVSRSSLSTAVLRPSFRAALAPHHSRAFSASMTVPQAKPQVLLMDPIKLATPLLDDLAKRYEVLVRASLRRRRWEAS